MNNYYDPFDCEYTCEEVYEGDYYGTPQEPIEDDEWEPFGA